MNQLKFQFLSLLFFGLFTTFIALTLINEQAETRRETAELLELYLRSVNKPQIRSSSGVNSNKQHVNLYSDHDSKMQRQDIVVKNHEGKLVLLFWKAICDERAGSYKKVVVLSYTNNGTEPAESVLKEMRNNTKFRNEKGELFVNSATTHVTFHALRSAVFIICSFMRYTACPKRITIDFGNQTITRAMHVERQLHLKSSQRFRAPQIIVCLPAVTSYFDALRPSFLVEYFEYQRLAGVKKISMGELDKKIYSFGFDPVSQQILKHYKDIGFLEMHSVSVYSNNASNMHQIAENSKPIQSTYCYLKYAMISDYVIVQDLDEVVAFNSNLYRNLPRALLAAKDKKHRYFSFKLYDQSIARKCNFTKDFRNTTDFLISRANLYYRRNLNPGKTIHSSHVCQLPGSYSCFIYRKIPELFSDESMRKEEFHKLVSWMNNKEGVSFLRSLHFRTSVANKFYNEKDEQVNKDMCSKNNTIEFDWLAKLTPKLVKNTMDTLKKIYARQQDD